MTVALDQVCSAHFFRGVSRLYLKGVSLTLNMVCVLGQALHTSLGVYRTLQFYSVQPCQSSEDHFILSVMAVNYWTSKLHFGMHPSLRLI